VTIIRPLATITGLLRRNSLISVTALITRSEATVAATGTIDFSASIPYWLVSGATMKIAAIS
jgi:hypothetical protein